MIRFVTLLSALCGVLLVVALFFWIGDGVKVIELKYGVKSLDWHPYRNIIAVNGDSRKVSIIDAQSGKVIQSLKLDSLVSKGRRETLKFSPDGKFLVSLDFDEFDYEEPDNNLKKRLVAKVWSVDSWELIDSVYLDDSNKYSRPRGFCITGSGYVVITNGDTYILVYDVNSREVYYKGELFYYSEKGRVEYEIKSIDCDPGEDKFYAGASTVTSINGKKIYSGQERFARLSFDLFEIGVDGDVLERKPVHHGAVKVKVLGNGDEIVTSPSRNLYGGSHFGSDYGSWYGAFEAVAVRDLSDKEVLFELPLPKRKIHGVENYVNIEGIYTVPRSSIFFTVDSSKGGGVRLWDSSKKSQLCVFVISSVNALDADLKLRKVAIGTNYNIQFYSLEDCL